MLKQNKMKTHFHPPKEKKTTTLVDIFMFLHLRNGVIISCKHYVA